MKVIAVIPVHGRLPLLKLTIERLYLKNKIDHVICVGEKDNMETCIKAGAEFIKHPNKPIGKKINKGFLRAKQLQPDAVSFVGSSDWLSDNWFDLTVPFTEKYDIIGKRQFNMVHKDKYLTVAEWQGYHHGSGRERELIGIGRVCSASFLEKIKWMPVDDNLNNSLDYAMVRKLGQVRGTTFEYSSEAIQSLSVSCNLWGNMHSFNSLLIHSVINMDPEEWLRNWFPEIFSL